MALMDVPHDGWQLALRRSPAGRKSRQPAAAR
jgi:hypothetical protein